METTNSNSFMRAEVLIKNFETRHASNASLIVIATIWQTASISLWEVFRLHFYWSDAFINLHLNAHAGSSEWCEESINIMIPKKGFRGITSEPGFNSRILWLMGFYGMPPCRVWSFLILRNILSINIQIILDCIMTCTCSLKVQLCSRKRWSDEPEMMEAVEKYLPELDFP